MARRPATFHDFIGQKEAIDCLRRLGEGAQTRSEPFPHCLLRGLSGLGKTLLARVLATVFGASFLEARGQLSRQELALKFAKIQLHDFVFVDEAHLLKAAAQDLVMELIDDLSIMAPKPKEGKAGTTDNSAERIQIPPCTVILATDHPGALCNALRRRMADEVALRLYRPDELKEIAEHVAKTTNLLVSPQAARQLAELAHGLPATVKRYLDRIRLFFPNSETEQVGIPQLKAFLNSSGIDDNGLGREDRRYLRHLYSAGSAGKESLALFLGTDVAFVRQEIEPVLLRQGLIKIGKRGRRLTAFGEETVSAMTTEHEEKEDHADGDDQGR